MHRSNRRLSYWLIAATLCINASCTSDQSAEVAPVAEIRTPGVPTLPDDEPRPPANPPTEVETEEVEAPEAEVETATTSPAPMRCPTGFEGVRCDIDIDDCAGAPCHNGGACVDRVAGFDCQCADGYSGRLCSINVDDCAAAPCQNEGHCIDLVNGFECECAAGFEGAVCDIDIDDCASAPCQNNSVCTDLVDSFECECAVGFEGATCAVNIDDCAAVPCQNAGACIDRINGFECVCTTGWEGVTCADNIDDCADAPCQNGGQCVDLLNAFDCECGEGFKGSVCETEVLVIEDVMMSATASCALMNNKQIKCWGGHSYMGQLGSENVAVGDEPGEQGDDLPYVDLGSDGWVVDSETARYSPSPAACARLNTGKLKCWGNNAYGQLGYGDTIARGATPGMMGDALLTVDLGAGKVVVDYAMGDQHACALMNDGSVVCWGANHYGQLGQGHTEAIGDEPGEMGDGLRPVDLAPGLHALQLRATSHTTCALLSDQTIKCWGANRSAVLGQGHVEDLGDDPDELGDNLPSIDLPGEAVDFGLGWNHACALLDNGRVYCWGTTYMGAIGPQPDDVGDKAGEIAALEPLDFGADFSVVQLSVGTFHSCVILADETGAEGIKCWGANWSGQLGLGHTDARGLSAADWGDNLQFVDYGEADALSVTADAGNTCVVRADKSLACWGSNFAGQVGIIIKSKLDRKIGDEPGEMGDGTPTVNLGDGVSVDSVSIATHICASTTDGGLKCWGPNTSGQLGLGWASDNGAVPGALGANSKFVDLGTDAEVDVLLGATRFTFCARLTSGEMKCWGWNNRGILGLGDELPRGPRTGDMGDNLPVVDLGTDRTAMAVNGDYEHTCAQLDDGSLKCWGGNKYGQLGQGDHVRRGDEPGEMGDHLPAIELGTGRTVVDHTSGMRHVCVILDDGGVKCWGEAGPPGRLGIGTTARIGNEPGEMGDNLPYVNLGDGHTAKSLASGYFTTCAVLDNDRVKCWGANHQGQLGYGDTLSRGASLDHMGDHLPYVDLGEGRTVKQLAGYGSGYCALLDNDTVVCWGRNHEGNLGTGGPLGTGDTNDVGDEPGEMGNALKPIDFGTGLTALKLSDNSSGWGHMCALLSNNRVKCWGHGKYGALGTGDRHNRGDEPGEMGDALPFVDLDDND